MFLRYPARIETNLVLVHLLGSLVRLLAYLLADLVLEVMIGQLNIQQTGLLDLESTILGLQLA